MPRILLFLLTLLLAGCTLPKVDPAREAQADRVYELLRRNDVAGLREMAGPILLQQDLPEAVQQMQSHIHASTPTAVETAAWNLNIVNGDATYEVARLYSHPEGKVQVRVTMMRSGDAPYRVEGLHVMRVSPALLKAHEESIKASGFTLTGKTPAHYAVLGAAVLAFLACVVTAVTAGIRRRWLWMIGCLFGFGKVALNWTTGAMFVQPISIALLGAGALKGLGPADPWVISASIPLPAILFWALGRWRKKAPKTKARAAEPDSWTTDA
ncbi:hypothetical protein [Brevundimonas sp. FT23028]|uniref:hypothetical protein n=1 Tax=Brevundimonas sp. FT23028 TaxID=3393748 RepID=UPI003B58B0AB